MMKTNTELQTDVQNAIKREPLLHAAEIGVTVQDGIVSLTGIVDTYAKKMEAESATKKVAGVKAVVEDIEVHIPESWYKSDKDIAIEVLAALKSNLVIPRDKVTIKVENGWVTLEGELSWKYQSDAAIHATTYRWGVKGVSNNIKIRSESNDNIEKREVENALSRSWSLNGSDIQVKVEGTKVILTGTVRSWYQKTEAGHIAWKTPGIWIVENNIDVDYYFI